MPDHHLDITRETCPMTFVRTRLALDRIVPGEVLHVLLSGGEPHRNVVGNASSLGHAVIADEPRADGIRLVSIRRL
ncbi:sulfurtransferase TusA family protein [Lichenicoccus sp.]|uniref:sulfurtransferase TusA family protein n=1 Tax=Lichenicoccus sp. TaxID=2781899 RepID=UPI003D121F6B